MHNPVDVARNMITHRGQQGALERCDKYISGAIRSENTKEFWERVKAAVKAITQL